MLESTEWEGGVDSLLLHEVTQAAYLSKLYGFNFQFTWPS